MKFRMWKGGHWMIQLAAWAGPFNLGFHFDIRSKYIDIHLPYVVITLGNVNSVAYPNCWHCSSRESCTGVKYASN